MSYVTLYREEKLFQHSKQSLREALIADFFKINCVLQYQKFWVKKIFVDSLICMSDYVVIYE